MTKIIALYKEPLSGLVADRVTRVDTTKGPVAVVYLHDRITGTYITQFICTIDFATSLQSMFPPPSNHDAA